MLNIAVGKAKTGKSKYIMDLMDEDIKNNKNVIFFVPSQMRMLSEEKYMEYQKKRGIININFTTIASFVSEYIDKHKLIKDKKYISKMDRKIIVNKLISENEEIFKIFKKCKNLDGFIENIEIYMDLFKKENVSLNNIDNSFDESEVIISSKLKEIYAFYKKYLEEIKSKYIDSIDEIDLFVNSFNMDKQDVKNTKIYFDSYNNFTKAELKFIKKLLEMGFDITIAIASNIMDYAEDVEDILDINKISNILASNSLETNIFSTYNLTVIEIIKMAKLLNIKIEVIPFLKCVSCSSSKDLKLLADTLYLDSLSTSKIDVNGLHINFTTNMYTELTSIASNILEKVKNEKCRFSDFVIFTSNVEEYENVIKNIFEEYKIPIHIDSKVNITNSSIYKYIHNVLSMCSYKISFDTLFKTLKLYMLDVSKEDIYTFENYCLEYNIRDEYKFKYGIKEEKKFAYDIESLKKFKENVIDMYLSLKENINNCKTSKDIVRVIYKHLLDSNVINSFEKQTIVLDGSEDTYFKYLASLNNSIWQSICEIFDSISKIYEDKEISIKKFFEIFKGVSTDITKKGVPATIDEVELLDVNSSKSLEKKVVFFIGVNEGKFPSNIKEDLFFSDKDISILKTKYDISFREDSISKINMQNYNIYEALNTAQNEIFISYLSSDSEGKALRPSTLITNILEFTSVSVNNTLESSYLTVRQLAKELTERVNKNIIDEKTIAIYNFLLEDEKYSSVVNYIREAKNLSKDTLSRMYDDDNINSSVSRLEQFKSCPFSYFIKYALKVDERKVYKITSLDLGSFMHSVLEKFSKYLFDENIAWQEVLINDRLLKVLEDIIEESLKQNLYMHTENVKYAVLKRKLLNTMKHAIITIAKSFNQSKFVPYSYELEFSENSEYRPIEIKLSEDKTMRLVGKIDRVDTVKVDETIYTRIVDYKSSSKDLSIDDVKEGISLQLITYLAAFMKHFKDEKIKPAGVMYFNLSDKLLKLGEYILDEEKVQSKINEELRMKGIFLSDMKILEIMDNKIETSDRLINVSSRTVKSGKESKSLLNEESFESICNEIKDILKSIGKELILDGNVEIKPNKKKDACKYCKYMSICRKTNMC